MSPHSLRRLLILELERYWNFPVAEVIFAIAMFAFWNRQLRADQLGLSYVYVPIFLIFIVGVTTARSFAGSIGSREMITLLSYPLERRSIFVAKFIVNLLMPFALFAVVVLFTNPILGLNILEPEIYVTMTILFVHTLFLCSVAMLISLAVKSETMSVFAFVLSLFGFEFSLVFLESPYVYLTLVGGHNVIFEYLTSLFNSTYSRYAFQDFTLAFAFPLATSAVVLIASFIYFQWIMQLD